MRPRPSPRRPRSAVRLLGIVGLAGSALNRRLDGDILLLAFAGLILVAAWRTVACCPSCTRGGETTAPRTAPAPGRRGGGPRRPATSTRLLKPASRGSVVGFLTGLFGVGGGFVIVPALASSCSTRCP